VEEVTVAVVVAEEEARVILVLQPERRL
jgi:hypothetical protein